MAAAAREVSAIAATCSSLSFGGLVPARQLRILAREHRPVLAPGMAAVDEGERARVGPLVRVFAVQILPRQAVGIGGLHVGVAYLD